MAPEAVLEAEVDFEVVSVDHPEVGSDQEAVREAVSVATKLARQRFLAMRERTG